MGFILSGYFGWWIPVCLGSYRYIYIVGCPVLVHQARSKKDWLYKTDSWLAHSLEQYISPKSSGIGESKRMYVQVRFNYIQPASRRAARDSYDKCHPLIYLKLTQPRISMKRSSYGLKCFSFHMDSIRSDVTGVPSFNFNHAPPLTLYIAQVRYNPELCSGESTLPTYRYDPNQPLDNRQIWDSPNSLPVPASY